MEPMTQESKVLTTMLIVTLDKLLHKNKTWSLITKGGKPWSAPPQAWKLWNSHISDNAQVTVADITDELPSRNFSKVSASILLVRLLVAMANVLGKLLYVTEYYCSQIVELSSKPASGTNKAQVSEFIIILITS